jgi:hypothetical protein
MDDNEHFNRELEALSCAQIETTPISSDHKSSRSQTEEPKEDSNMAMTPASEFDPNVKRSIEDNVLTCESRKRRRRRTKREMIAQYTQRRRSKRTSIQAIRADSCSVVAPTTSRPIGRPKKEEGPEPRVIQARDAFHMGWRMGG